MKRVESERAALEAYGVDCHGPLAPIRRMPTEVLVAIFPLCADDLCDDIRWRAIERLAQKPLLTLSQVSKRWHDIALGTPTLWDRLVLDAEIGLNPESRHEGESQGDVFGRGDTSAGDTNDYRKGGNQGDACERRIAIPFPTKAFNKTIIQEAGLCNTQIEIIPEDTFVDIVQDERV
ncbi:hypothetical protein C8R45DRAFT_1085152 [Mycena sanguinolenta]|nr:hypothetical protein C8R45DRAFT_1085152 [Mycena sanguinolenta]